MLEAVPKSIFSTNFRLQEQNLLLGEVDTSIWSEKAQLELEDGTYGLYRESLFSGDFILEHNGKVVARASKPSALKARFDVELLNRHIVLSKVSIWNRRFAVFDGENQIGSIYPLGLFTRRANIDLPAAWPLPIRIFLFWLVFLIWKRERQTSA